MFQTIKKWWNRNDTRFAELQNQIQSIKEDRDQIQSELTTVRTTQEADAAKKSSNEPWVEVRSAEFDANRGVQIDLDWNPAFISYLKENGIKGKTEEIIIQKWLAFLYEDLVQKLDEETTEQSVHDSKEPNEFQ